MPPDRSGIPVPPRPPQLPRERIPSYHDANSSTESTTQSDGKQEFSGSGKADSAEGDEQELSFGEMVREGLPNQGRPQPELPPTEEDEQELSFGEMVRAGLPNEGRPQPKPTPTEEGGQILTFREMVREGLRDQGMPQPTPRNAKPKLGVFEFFRQKNPATQLSPSHDAESKGKGKGSREKEKTSPASGAASGWGRLRQRVATESDQPRAAHTGADPAWGTVTPKPNVRGHGRNVSANVVAQTSPDQRAERRGEPEATPRSPRSRSLLEFTKGDRERWLIQAKGLASYASLFEFQIVMVKMAMAVEREDFKVWSEDKVFTFGRDDKGCVFDGQAVENVYRPIAESSLVALQNSVIAEEVDRQLSRLRQEYPPLRQSHIQTVDEMTRQVPSATEIRGAHAPKEKALAAYIAPVLLLVRGRHDSVQTSRLPTGMLQLAYALDYEVANLCLGKRSIDFAKFASLRKNMLISYLFTRGVSKFLLGQPGKHDSAIALFSSALNKELNMKSDAFIASVLRASLEKFPEAMKRKVYALQGQGGTAAAATAFASHSSQQDITLDQLELGDVKKLGAQLVLLSPPGMKRGINQFIQGLEKRNLPLAFLQTFAEAMEQLGETPLRLQAFSTYCLDTIETYWERHKKQGVAASRDQVEALLAVEREWRAQLAARQAASDPAVKAPT